jgi:hypothetical protein
MQHILAGAHDLLRVLRRDGQANLMRRVAVDVEDDSGASQARKEQFSRLRMADQCQQCYMDRHEC